MSNYFHIHENRWTKAYIVGDQQSFNLHLRKQYIVDEIRKLETNKDSKILDISYATGKKGIIFFNNYIQYLIVLI